MTQFQVYPGDPLPIPGPTMWLRLPRGCDSLCHGVWEFIPNNATGLVEVPMTIGTATLQHGRSGAVAIDPPSEKEVK